MVHVTLIIRVYSLCEHYIIHVMKHTCVYLIHINVMFRACRDGIITHLIIHIDTEQRRQK